MKGPTRRRSADGSARRTEKPPRSRSRASTTRGSTVGRALMGLTVVIVWLRLARWRSRMSAPAVARFSVVTLLVGALCGACTRPPSTPAQDAAPDRPPPPAAPAVRDAAPDVTDAAPDLAGQHARSPAHHPAAATAGGSGGFKIEGGISKPDA